MSTNALFKMLIPLVIAVVVIALLLNTKLEPEKQVIEIPLSVSAEANVEQK